MPTMNPFSLSSAADELISLRILPTLVAIYTGPLEAPHKIRQTGTGFVVRSQGKNIVITAKHCLDNTDLPNFLQDKSIFIDGKLRLISDLPRFKIINDPIHDVSLFHSKSIIRATLPQTSLTNEYDRTRVVSICGFLARDFRRHLSGGHLRPAPIHLMLTRAKRRHGYIDLNFNIRKGTDVKTGNRRRKPVPEGLSGCPMMDTAELLKGRIKVVGVFTQYNDYRLPSLATGESAQKINDLLRFI